MATISRWARIKPHVAASPFLWGILIILAAVQVWFLLATPYINHDVALLLSEGARIVHGGLPYVDVIDVNPPTVIYLSAIPGGIASLLNLPLYQTGRFFWWVIVMGSIGFIAWLIRRVFPEKTLLDFLFLTAVLLQVNLQVYAVGDYAQRDHLIILWLIAFSLVRYARYGGMNIPGGVAIVAGIAAGLALAMKPQYLIVPVLVELLLSLWHKRFKFHLHDWELLLGSLVAVVFVLHPLFIPPMAGGSRYWLEKIARSYEAYNPETLASIFSKPIESQIDLIWLLLSLSLAWLALLTRKSTTFRGSALFGVLGLIGFILILIQFKGFSYHTVPFRLCTVTGLGFLISDLAAFLQSRHRSTVLAVAGLLLLLIGFTSPDIRWMFENSTSENAYKYVQSDFTEIVTVLADPHESVMFISTSVLPAYPAISCAERRSAGRFQTAFPIAFMYHSAKGYELPEGWEEFEMRFLRYELEDIRREQPAVLLISAEKHPQALPPGFIISEYLNRRGFYDSLGTDYKVIGSHQGFRILLRNIREAVRDRTPATTDPDSLESVQLLRRRGLLSAARDTTGT